MPFSGSFIAFHMQDPFEQWNVMHAHAFQAGRKFRVLKSFHPEDYKPLQAASPGTPFVYRHHIEDSHQGAFVERAGISAAEADAAADEYILQFADSVNEHMGEEENGLKYAESLNEEYPTHNPEKLAKIVAFDRAFVRRLKVHCPGVRPIVFTAAVGNPDHDEYGALVQLAQETAAAKGAFGYHGYWTVYNGKSFVNDPGVAKDLHMRWNEVDKYLVARGIRVKWLIGECGATKGNAAGYQPDVIAGWKDPNVWGGNEDAYLTDISNFDALLSQTLAAKEGRLIGATLFTSRPGEGGTWKWFNVTGSMAWKVANYVASKAPVTIPEPPKDEEEMLSAADKQQLWNVSVEAQIATGISLNPGAKLQGAILADGFTPVLKEGRFTGSDARLWAYQPAEKVDGAKPRRVYVCEVLPGPSYGDVYWFVQDGTTGTPSAGDAVWAPVGTLAERQSGKIWPGDWSDANPYGNWYALRDGFAYHTGADLNLNKPSWNADKGKEVYAVANGEVTYAGRWNELWGNMVIIRHSARGGFYARYAHLGSIAVKKRDVVHIGQQVGTVGGADVGLPDHLHFDISLTDKLLQNPGDWPGSSLQRLHTDYVDPKAFLNLG